MGTPLTLNRMHIAHEYILLWRQTCRRNSKLPQLVDLFMTHPFVSIPPARKKFKVNTATVDRMLDQLGSTLPGELNGRGRYRGR